MDYIVLDKGLILKKTHDLAEAEKIAEAHKEPTEIYQRERLGRPYVLVKKVKGTS